MPPSPRERAPGPPLISPDMALPFTLVTLLFALWGFANDVTNPLVKAFKDVFVISNAQSSLVQTAFYGGYATMAVPAALFIRRYSFKAGILVGLALFAIGALISIPAAATINFNLFLVSLYILTFGLAFLETTANPYILSMGPTDTATRRLNLAQAFNPMGSLIGMTVASAVILENLKVEDIRTDIREYLGSLTNASSPVYIDPVLKRYLDSEEERLASLSKSLEDLPYNSVLAKCLSAFKADVHFTSFHGQKFAAIQEHDLSIIKAPYVVIGVVVITVFVVFLFTKMPDTKNDTPIPLGATLRILFRNRRYREGLVAQGFYVGAQIMCWTFIIHYATRNIEMEMSTAQLYNLIGMIIFCCCRFICTFALKYLSAGRLLLCLALGAISLNLGTIFFQGYPGLYCLVGISGCMSLMFPTIYGIALHGMGDEAKLGSAGLIFSIVGGALLTPLQGSLIDLSDGLIFGLPAVNVSFVLSLISFIIIAIYAVRVLKDNGRQEDQIQRPTPQDGHELLPPPT